MWRFFLFLSLVLEVQDFVITHQASQIIEVWQQKLKTCQQIHQCQQAMVMKTSAMYVDVFCSVFDMRCSKHKTSRKRTFLLLSFPLPCRILQEIGSLSAPKVTQHYGEIIDEMK